MSELQPSELQPSERQVHEGADSRIDEALQVLRETRSPAGMEARMLAAVERAQAEPSSASAIAPNSAWVWGGLAAGIAIAVVAGAAFLGIRNHSIAAPDSSRSRQSEVRQASVVQGLIRKGPVTNKSGNSGSVNNRSARLVSGQRVLTEEGERRGLRVAPGVVVSEANLPSMPAPPLPLTKEERLLLRIAQAHPPEQLAKLDPLVWAAKAEEEKAEFQKFFGETEDKGGSE